MFLENMVEAGRQRPEKEIAKLILLILKFRKS
jgi:hypothetical protein